VPFTLAHPAIVLPLRSRWPGAFLALVAGSMGPDLPYFLPANSGLALPNGHTLTGSVLVSLPLAVALLALVVLGRGVIVAPLWSPYREVVGAELERVWRSRSRWPLAIPIVYLGICTHLLWDGFTHRHGWFVRHISALAEPVEVLPGYPTEVCRILQYVSSVVGCVLIVWWSQRLIAAKRAPSDRLSFRTGRNPSVLWGIGAASCLWGWERLRRTAPNGDSLHGAGYILTTCSVGAFVCLYLLLGCVLLADQRRYP